MVEKYDDVEIKNEFDQEELSKINAKLMKTTKEGKN